MLLCFLNNSLLQKEEVLKHLLSLMKQVAVAVAYTHANKVAHMDIKPENILLDETKALAARISCNRLVAHR